MAIIKSIFLIYLFACTFVSNHMVKTAVSDVAEHQIAQNEEKNNLFYREYSGAYVDLLQDASIIVTGANVDTEEENLVCLVNASNEECIFKPFVEGVSFDNVASGRYYVYICQAKDGKIVDASPDVNIFYPVSESGASEVYMD